MDCCLAGSKLSDLVQAYRDTVGSEANVRDSSLVTVRNIPGVNVQSDNIPDMDIHEEDVSIEKENSCILLCVDGQVNGIQVRFLIDTGASEFFNSGSLVKENDMIWSKRQEKMKVHLADGSMRPCSHCLKGAYVSFEACKRIFGRPCDEFTQI